MSQFTAPDLAAVAHELDTLEQSTLDEESQRAASTNMDDTGTWIPVSAARSSLSPPYSCAGPSDIVGWYRVLLCSSRRARLGNMGAQVSSPHIIPNQREQVKACPTNSLPHISIAYTNTTLSYSLVRWRSEQMRRYHERP